ncbi:MAG: helix-turn-helix domain-containing protein [Clostridia bacterium]|nr:helix-turn-helix domain-containing protein [Clostridia bacterium]
MSKLQKACELSIEEEFAQLDKDFNKLKALRERSGMNLKQFSEYFNIPYRTLQHWEAGDRKCPEYLLDLIEYKLLNEHLIKGYDDFKKQLNKKQNGNG